MGSAGIMPARENDKCRRDGGAPIGSIDTKKSAIVMIAIQPIAINGRVSRDCRKIRPAFWFMASTSY